MPTVHGQHVWPVPHPVIPPGTTYYPMNQTGEIFLSPRDFNERLAFYMQPIFACEATGRHGLNWFTASAFERQDADLVQALLPISLKTRIVQSVHTLHEPRLDNLADRVFARLERRFFVGDRCLATVGGETYACAVVGVFPPAEIRAIMPPTPRSDPSLSSSSTFRMPGQRADLLSPPAVDGAALADRYAGIAHAIGCSQTLTPAAAEAQDPSADYTYSIQLLSPQGQFSASTTEARASALQRDPIVLNVGLVRRYLLSAFDRSGGAYATQWIVKPHLAAQFGIPPPLPAPPNGSSAQMAPSHSSESRKRSAHPSDETDSPAPPAKAPRKAADKPAAPARRGPRYPCEDLEIDPVAPAAPKPAFERTLPIEGEYFEEMLQSWSFLNTFGNALHLTNFSLDSYINALKHSTLDPPCRLLAEIHAALAIPVVAEALRIPHTAPATSTGTLPMLAADLAELDDGMTPKDRQVAVRRALAYCRKWDRSTRLKVVDGRAGWVKHVIGTLCHRGGIETIERLPAILRHLTAGVVESEAEEESEDEDASSITLDAANAGSEPSETTTAPPEEQYLSLPVPDKLVIIDFMIDLVLNGRAVRQFVDDAELNCFNLRKDYADIGKERRAAAIAKQVNDALLASEAAAAPAPSPEPPTNGHASTPPTNGSTSNGQHLSLPTPPRATVGSDVDELESVGSEDAPSTTSAAEPAAPSMTRGKSKSGSRQTAMHKGKLKKDAAAAAEQAKRAAAEAEAAAIAAAKPPTEAERIEGVLAELDRREESFDRELRRWTEVARARPLGSDRHHNKYWWLDGIGSMGLISSGPSGAHIWGSGRLFVQAPTFDDLDAIEAARLLKPSEPVEEGVETKPEELFEQRRRIEEGADATPLPLNSWAIIDSEETLDQLVAWLNCKGKRELALHAALGLWRPNIVGGMLKRKADLEREAQRIEAAANRPKGRSGKLMTTSAADGPSYLQYVNRLAIQPR